MVLEKIVPLDAAAIPKPVCLAGERRCPPEDVGGPSGYQEFLEVIFEPGHEEFEHYREWAGDAVHAEDVKAVNEIPDRMRWPKRHIRWAAQPRNGLSAAVIVLPLSLRRLRLHLRELRALRTVLTARNVVTAIAPASTAFISGVIIFVGHLVSCLAEPPERQCLGTLQARILFVQPYLVTSLAGLVLDVIELRSRMASRIHA